jgi:exonuclease SbcC
MRLHSLELQAFGPYATLQRIDFDRLAGGGLFLLEGPTGAGKTTILDAITFALYGGLAGQDSAADRLHSDFADPETEPAVRLEFSVAGVRYLVHRVPEHQRLKRRGHGYTTESMRVHLQRLEDCRWVSVSSNKAPSCTTRSPLSLTSGGRRRCGTGTRPVRRSRRLFRQRPRRPGSKRTRGPS